MNQNFEHCMEMLLVHEGGIVNGNKLADPAQHEPSAPTTSFTERMTKRDMRDLTGGRAACPRTGSTVLDAC